MNTGRPKPGPSHILFKPFMQIMLIGTHTGRFK
jgi:hypothetical protein